MSKLVVVTRPVEDAHDYALELQAAGYETHVEPMLSLQGIDFECPSLEAFDGLLLTSANAVRFLISGLGHEDSVSLGMFSSVPVYCVGKYTATAARNVGFESVISVDGTGKDLVDYIVSLNARQDDDLRVLHIRGKHLAYPIKDHLEEKGVFAEQLIVYESLKADHFSERFLSLLQGEHIEAITFFSRRTAENFAMLVREGGLQDTLRHIKLLSISEGVLECVRFLPWSSMYVSSTPDRLGMMQLLEAYV